MTMTLRRLSPVLVLVLAAPMWAQSGYEGPRTFESSEVLPAAALKGSHFTVGPEAKTDGYFYQFVLTTDYGTLEVEGKTLLEVRLREVDALSKLAEVSKSEVFLAAAGNSVLNVGKGAVSAVRDPAATAKGIGGGVKRFGTNLGRTVKSTTDSASSPGDPNKNTTDKMADAGQAAAYSVLGVNSAMRRWAQKVGADPYTTNPILRKALEDIGQIDAAGSIAAKVVVPIPMVVSAAGSVGDLVWGKDPQELQKLNETRVAELGVDGNTARAFFKAKGFTLTYQTVFIDALHAVKANGAADYVRTASTAETEREALFFMEGAQMLRKLHASAPVEAVLPDSRAMVAKTDDGRAVVLLPVDWLRWSSALEEGAAEIAARGRQELSATRLELVMTGQVSQLARQKLTALGWKIDEGVELRPSR